MNTGMTRIGAKGLWLPPQVASVERKMGASAFTKGGGVEPSWDFFKDFLPQVAQTVGPMVAQAAPGLISGLLSAI